MPIALVTGISGQDGSYLSENLLDEGYEVHGVVRSTADSDRVASPQDTVTYHEADLTDPSRVDRLIADVQPDYVYNLAALSSVFQSWQDPVYTAQVNAVPVAQILESAWRLQESAGRPVHVIQASSAELFGQPDRSPQDELTPIRPSSPYGASKAYAHHLVGVYRQRGLFSSSVILYNHESPRRPESFVTRKITAAVSRIAAGRQDRLELGSLDARRDWGWAPDYVRALQLAATATEPDDFVIATGQTHSIADFVTTAFARIGIADWAPFVTINDAFARPVDPAEQVGDASKARTVLGWTPTMGFEEIVGAMVDADVALTDGSSD
jgi:GDPmannose 4,6-dehydratase